VSCLGMRWGQAKRSAWLGSRTRLSMYVPRYASGWSYVSRMRTVHGRRVHGTGNRVRFNSLSVSVRHWPVSLFLSLGNKHITACCSLVNWVTDCRCMISVCIVYVPEQSFWRCIYIMISKHTIDIGSLSLAFHNWWEHCIYDTIYQMSHVARDTYINRSRFSSLANCKCDKLPSPLTFWSVTAQFRLKLEWSFFIYRCESFYTFCR
jgi:hypothetical protein